MKRLAFALCLAACGGGGDGGDGNGNPDAGVDPTAPDAFVAVWKFDDVYGVPNLDDDDGATMDWTQPPFATDDDYATLLLPARTLEMVPPGGSVSLALSGDPSKVRVY